VSGCGQNRLAHDSSAWRVEAISQMEGFAEYPVGAPPERLGFRLRVTPPQVPTSATCPTHRERRAASAKRPGRLVGASHSRSRTTHRERRAKRHRASRANAQAATRRSLPGHRTQPDRIGPCRLQLKMQPQLQLARSEIHTKIMLNI
jgi:hypothetical protein